MINQSQLSGYILSSNGMPVRSLSFVPSSDNSYIGVYAQYSNNPEWVPLNIGLSSVPTLQQVRDMNRNISMNEGSYEDAHFYLRSAAGNNVTTAFYTNTDGGAIQSGDTDSYTALNLQPLGGLLTYGGNEVATLDSNGKIMVSQLPVIAVNNGGTGAATLTGVGIGNGTSAFTGVTGTANQLLRRNAANTAYEFFTPIYLTSVPTLQQVTTAGNSITNSIALTGGTNGTSLYIDAAASNYTIRAATSTGWARGLIAYDNTGTTILGAIGFLGNASAFVYGYMGLASNNAIFKWTNTSVGVGFTSTNSPSQNFHAILSSISNQVISRFESFDGFVDIKNAGAGGSVMTPMITGTGKYQSAYGLMLRGTGNAGYTAAAVHVSGTNATDNGTVTSGNIFAVNNYTTNLLNIDYLGVVRITGLAGTGSRIVVADTSGNLSTISTSTFIQNQSATSQTADFRITGTGRVDSWFAIGNTGSTAVKLYNRGNITGSTTAYGTYNLHDVQTDVTANIYGCRVLLNFVSGAGASNVFYQRIGEGTLGGSNTVGTVYGILIDDLTVGGTNIGIQTTLSAGANKWNIYASGGASNYFAGRTGFGSTNLTGIGIRNTIQITGGATSYGMYSDGQIQSDVTSLAVMYHSQPSASATVALGNLYHFQATQGTYTAGSTINTQVGFMANASLIAGAANVGFYGNIPSGSSRYNLYMNGTANNFLAGKLGIGDSNPIPMNISLSLAMNGGGTTSAWGMYSSGQIQNNVTASAHYFQTISSTAATTFTINSIKHYSANQGTFGAGSTVQVQTGFHAETTLVGAGLNWGFRGNIPFGSGRWNIYMDGTASNYMEGTLGIGVAIPTTFHASATLFPSFTPKMEVMTGNSAGTAYNEGIVIRHSLHDATVVNRNVGVVFKLSTEASAGESTKAGAIMLGSASTFANSPNMDFYIGNDATYKMRIWNTGVITTTNSLSVGTQNAPARFSVLGSAHSTPASTWFTNSPLAVFSGEGATGNTNSDVFINHASDTSAARPFIVGRRTKGTLATPTSVVSGNPLFSILSSGFDGTGFYNAAEIQFYVDGTVSTGVVPTGISFQTSTNSTRMERMFISSGGSVRFNGQAGTGTRLATVDSTGVLGNITNNFLTSISGTTNRISVSGTTIDIASTYVGQASITTLGTIGTGTWNGTTIAVNKGGTGLTSTGANGNVLMAHGSAWVSTTPTWVSNNVYTADGTLTGNRVVDCNGNGLTFSNNGGFYVTGNDYISLVTFADNIEILSNTGIYIGTASSYSGYVQFTNLTANRNWYFPNKNGTFAVLDDLQALTLQDVASVGNTFNGDIILGISGSELYVGSTSVGDGNTRLGRSTLTGLTTGNWNTAIGSEALKGLTTGVNNTAIGEISLVDLVSGDSNSAVGDSAGLGVSGGSNNTYIGIASGIVINGIRARGNCNTFIGRKAGCYTIAGSATLGSNNIALGLNAGQDKTNADNQLFIGNYDPVLFPYHLIEGVMGTSQTLKLNAEVTVSSLNGSGTRMVVADADGVLSTQAIGSLVSQWVDNGYNYLSANDPNIGSGNGIYSNGGYASNSQELIAPFGGVDDNVEFVYRIDPTNSDWTLYLPDPSSFPNRVLNITNFSTDTNSGIILDGSYLPMNTDGGISVDYISSVKGDSTLPQWIQIMSIYTTIGGTANYYWMVIKAGRKQNF